MSSKPPNSHLYPLNPTSMDHSFSSILCFLSLVIFFFTFTSHSSTTSFFPTNNLTLYGDAHFINNSISLTHQLPCLSPPPSSPSSSLSSSDSPSLGVGRALYMYPIRFLDYSTNKTASFSCRFSFTIKTPSPSCPFGDGIAFLIASNADSLSMSDGSLGLPGRSLDAQHSFLAVEFDTSFNPSLGDINDNHVGIDLNRVISIASIDGMSKGIDLKSGKRMTAWIEYKDFEKMIRVWVGDSQVSRHSSPLLAAPIDLSNRFEEFMHVGFSASNGRGSATHLVDRWQFKTFEFLSTTMPMETVEAEVDCLVCFPRDSSFSDENDFSDSNHRTNKMLLELALGVGGLVVFIMSLVAVFIFVIMCLIRRRSRRRKCKEQGQMYRFHGNSIPKRMSLAEIRSATKGFDRHKILGEGASATVYEASLPSCGSVAVKRFSQVNQTGCLGNQFATEFATMMGCLRHKNLVQLHGWCCERHELVLVYEFMINGSVDKLLHSRTNAAKYLTWERRLNIVLGVASALIYLHEECERQIIHRDVKTCNILLDREFNAKLGDFGLAEVYEHSSRTRVATVPAGTMGYLAPEYVYSGVPTVKTDVYSFGVVVLEVASGRQPVDYDGTVLPDWVWKLWEKRVLIEAVDPRLMGCFNRMDMQRMLMVGLICVHPDYVKRPIMKEAARMLKGEAPLPNLPDRKPRITICSVLPEESDEILLESGEKWDATPWSTPRTHFSRN